MSVADARRQFADVLNDAVRGHVTYITNRGRRIAAVVPVPMAEGAEREQSGTQGEGFGGIVGGEASV